MGGMDRVCLTTEYTEHTERHCSAFETAKTAKIAMVSSFNNHVNHVIMSKKARVAQGLSAARYHGMLTHFCHDRHRLFAVTLRLGLARQGVVPAAA